MYYDRGVRGRLGSILSHRGGQEPGVSDHVIQGDGGREKPLHVHRIVDLTWGEASYTPPS